MSVKIVIISDTHMGHEDIVLPPGDILIHCGDATFQGSEREIRTFNEWLGRQPFKERIFIAGNHDLLFEKEPGTARSLITNAHYLEDSSVNINGLLIYGSPWQPAFNSWAFNLWKPADLKAKWDMIPQRTDVLVTHGPPRGILDQGKGCKELLLRVLELPLKLHCFGHIHGGYGRFQAPSMGDGTTFINASIMNDEYNLANAPQVFEI